MGGGGTSSSCACPPRRGRRGRARRGLLFRPPTFLRRGRARPACGDGGVDRSGSRASGGCCAARGAPDGVSSSNAPVVAGGGGGGGGVPAGVVRDGRGGRGAESFGRCQSVVDDRSGRRTRAGRRVLGEPGIRAGGVEGTGGVAGAKGGGGRARGCADVGTSKGRKTKTTGGLGNPRRARATCHVATADLSSRLDSGSRDGGC